MNKFKEISKEIRKYFVENICTYVHGSFSFQIKKNKKKEELVKDFLKDSNSLSREY